jgi:hypothetical protein
MANILQECFESKTRRGQARRSLYYGEPKWLNGTILLIGCTKTTLANGVGNTMRLMGKPSL